MRAVSLGRVARLELSSSGGRKVMVDYGFSASDSLMSSYVSVFISSVVMARCSAGTVAQARSGWASRMQLR